MKFKIEIFLLLTSIVLFAASALCFSWAASNGELASALSLYPYRDYAFPFVGFGGALMTVGAVSYSKRSKQIL